MKPTSNMAPQPNAPQDYVAWAKLVNSRWIAHHDLNRHAESYLDHLAQTDPSRLVLSCRNAHLMIGQCDGTEDPKPWFYSGLFSCATPEEVARFLADHWLTRLVMGSVDESSPTPDSLSATTVEKVQRIQAALAKLPPT